jgi:hypothetical protein
MSNADDELNEGYEHLYETMDWIIDAVRAAGAEIERVSIRGPDADFDFWLGEGHYWVKITEHDFVGIARQQATELTQCPQGPRELMKIAKCLADAAGVDVEWGEVQIGKAYFDFWLSDYRYWVEIVELARPPAVPVNEDDGLSKMTVWGSA